MSKSLAIVAADTAFGSPQNIDVSRANLNYGADWHVLSEKPGEIIIVNNNSTIDRPEKLRVAYQKVNNVYTGSGIPTSAQSAQKGGVSILVQLTQVGRITESTTGVSVDVPFSYHIVIKVPADELVTSSVIIAGIARLFTGLFNENSGSLARLTAMLKGAISFPEI